jgi:hypothetical protein
MHGVAGRKGVVGLARAWNAMTAAMDHLPIRPLLVDHPLQKMRQDRGRGHAQNQMIGLSTRTIIAIPRRQPKSGRDRKQQVFIGSPGQEPGRALYNRACMPCNRPSHPLVELGGGSCHRAIINPPLPGQFPTPRGS